MAWRPCAIVPWRWAGSDGSFRRGRHAYRSAVAAGCGTRARRQQPATAPGAYMGVRRRSWRIPAAAPAGGNSRATYPETPRRRRFGLAAILRQSKAGENHDLRRDAGRVQGSQHPETRAIAQVQIENHDIGREPDMLQSLRFGVDGVDQVDLRQAADQLVSRAASRRNPREQNAHGARVRHMSCRAALLVPGDGVRPQPPSTVKGNNGRRGHEPAVAIAECQRALTGPRGEPSLLHQAVPQGVSRQVSVRAEIHLLQDARAVGAHRLDADAQLPGDLRDAASHRQLAQNLEFAL